MSTSPPSAAAAAAIQETIQPEELKNTNNKENQSAEGTNDDESLIKKPQRLQNRNVSWAKTKEDDSSDPLGEQQQQYGRTSSQSSGLVDLSEIDESDDFMEVPTPTNNTSPNVGKGMNLAYHSTNSSLVSILTSPKFETEAETYIANAIDEESNASKNGPPEEYHQSILGDVPIEASPETFTAEDDTEDNNNKGGREGDKETINETSSTTIPTPAAMNANASISSKDTSASRPIKKKPQQQLTRKKSTAEELFSLRQDMANLHAKSIRTMNNEFMNNIWNDDNYSRPKAGGDGDAFARNANNIVKRAVSKKNVGGGTGASKWKKVKTSVEVAGAVNAMKKKTDRSVAEASQQNDVELGNNNTNGDVAINNNDDDGDNNDDNNNYEVDHNVGKHLWMRRTKKNVAANYKDFEDWLQYKRLSTKSYIQFILFYLIVPLTGIAGILFYLVGNPPCGTTTQCNQELIDQLELSHSELNRTVRSKLLNLFTAASISWWLLFAVRQLITLSLSLALQAFIVEYLALRSRWTVKTVGPLVTLFLVQSKGWPMVLFFWGMFDFLMLYGDSQFAHHWLFWQEQVRMMNYRNPSGMVTSSPTYRNMLICGLAISFAVALKRFFVGLHLGKTSFERYGADLAKLMKKAYLISKVAHLAQDIEQKTVKDHSIEVSRRMFVDEINDENANALKDVEKSSEKEIRISELLEKWDEPDVSRHHDGPVDISAIIQFREALSYLDTPFPFSVSFGSASTRVEVIESSELVYRRLLMRTPNANILKFDTLALLAVDRAGTLNEDTAKDLIRLFRPDRDGKLSLIEFARSIDSVYKEMRLLRANVINSSKLDKTFGVIINIIFYILLGCIVLGSVGVPPGVVFASISSFILGFAFMIRTAASNYFEGLLFILVRKPYDVGDRINISDINKDTPPTGSPGWIVKDINLFTTTVFLAATNEVATYSNGSLAASRVINCARSPKANISFLFKFPLDTPFRRIEIFKSSIEKFIKARPQQWVSFSAFRSTRVEADLGFVEYITVAQHRDSWQNAGVLAGSKAELSSFALELMKQMGIRFKRPPMPIDLKVTQGMKNKILYGISGTASASGASDAASADGEKSRHKQSLSVASADSIDRFFGAAAAMFDKK